MHTTADESARRAWLEKAILETPGAFKAILDMPRHGVEQDRWDAVLSASAGLDRESPGRKFVPPEDSATLVRSLVKQEVLPPGRYLSDVTVGFDPDPKLVPDARSPTARRSMVHLFCGDVVIALFNLDKVGFVPEAFCVGGGLWHLDSSIDKRATYQWGRVWPYGNTSFWPYES